MKTTLTLLTLLVAGSASAQEYRLIDLGTLHGESEAFALGAAGGFAAGYSAAGDAHFDGAIFDSPSPIGALPGYGEQVAFATDGTGRVYGFAYTLGGLSSTAFVAEGQTVTPLGGFECRGANASGQLAGTVRVTESGLVLPRACRFDAGVQTLPTLGGQVSHGLAINAEGWVAGDSTTATSAAAKPCVWIGQTAHDLGTLGGPGGSVHAMAGRVAAGVSQAADGRFHATRWTLDEAGGVVSRTDLGVLRTGGTSYALGMNEAGAIVGTSAFHAVIWSGGQLRDLNTLVTPDPQWVLDKAWAIGEDGRIVGRGTRLGVPRAFMLLPCNGMCCDPDVNCDGVPDQDDVACIILAVAGDTSCFCQADPDFNHDGVPDQGDVADVILVVAGAPCP